MRSLVLVPLCVVCVMAGILVTVFDADLTGKWISSFTFHREISASNERDSFVPASENSIGSSVELVLDIERYDDQDYGFSMAIPAGWRRIVTADMTDDSGSQASGAAGSENEPLPAIDMTWMEPGYAVGFESAQQHDRDQFADYILVEILPGESSGLFAADVKHRQPIVIDGRSAWYDRLEIQQASTGLTDVDLVIYQAELAGVGYTVGLYAIGEHASERIMAIAFEVMLQTFKIDRPPFSVS